MSTATESDEQESQREMEAADGPDVYGASPLLLVPDVRAAVAFYSESLGFVAPPLSYADTPGYGVVERGWATIHFMPAGRNPVRPNHADNPSAADLFLPTSDVDSLFEEFANRGLTIVRGPETYPVGTRELVVEDCHGYWLCFAQEV